MLARTHPELPASEVFDPVEWQAAWLLAEKDPPKKTPPVREVIRRIAMLGGFLARKGDGEPGVKPYGKAFARASSFVRGGSEKCGRFVHCELCGMGWAERPETLRILQVPVQSHSPSGRFGAQVCDDDPGFFRARLDAMIDLRHPLAVSSPNVS